jgi:1-acyl-sn-glycerol-3-phosphate acyltransferase
MVTEAQKRRLFRTLRTGFDPAFARKIEPFLKGLYDHYFRCDMDGWENIPEGQALYVGNHNGMLTFEVLMLFYAWYKRYGTTKPAVGLAHSVALENPFFRWLIPRIGAIPADPEIAEEALAKGFSLLAYPGGEKESFRPFTERKKIDFYQRKGFIRLALKSNIPLVPIVSVGAHESYVILDRGEGIAKRLGLYDRLRLHGVPITFRGIFFLWCVVSGLFTFFPLLLAPAALAAMFVPLPSKMTFKILPPMDLRSLWDASLSEEQNHQNIYNHILSTMQRVHDEEYGKRRLPIIG